MIEYDRNNVTVLDNVLTVDQFNKLSTEILSDNFPWNLARIDPPTFDSTNYNTQFVHLFYHDDNVPTRSPGILSKHFSLLINLIKEINPFHLVRIKSNITLYTGEHTPGFYHTDTEFYDTGMTAVYYINTANGYTEFENGMRVESVENRLCIFPTSWKHRGVRSTNTPWRMVININWLTSS